MRKLILKLILTYKAEAYIWEILYSAEVQPLVAAATDPPTTPEFR